MDISATDRNPEPGDDPILFSTDANGSFRCTQPQTVKLAPEWVRTSDPVIRSPARYRWTTASANYSFGINFQNPIANLDIQRYLSLTILNIAKYVTIKI